jgi:GntR family transcriptional regulator
VRFELLPSSAVPIYRQIVDQIHRQLDSGQLVPGDTLPSVRDVARAHAINPMTVSKAYSLLESEGLVERQRGKPMRVKANSDSRLSARERLALLEPSLERLALEARQLGLAPDQVLAALAKKLEAQEK